jgi:hypothetical protein
MRLLRSLPSEHVSLPLIYTGTPLYCNVHCLLEFSIASHS